MKLLQVTNGIIDFDKVRNIELCEPDKVFVYFNDSNAVTIISKEDYQRICLILQDYIVNVDCVNKKVLSVGDMASISKQVEEKWNMQKNN